MDKILRINMGAEGGPKATETPVGEYAGLGGRALTSAIVAKEVPPLCHPLGENNKLILAPGLLSGTIAAMSGRLSVGCKSPLTGGIKEANSGGQASQVIARLGYMAIVLEGKPKTDDLYKIVINKDGVTIKVDNSLKLLGNYATVEKLNAEYGDKAAIMKKMFIDNGFYIVYDTDLEDPVADGFYFTVGYPGLTGGELITKMLYYGISAISLEITGSDRSEGLRACVSQVPRKQFEELEKRLKLFRIDHPVTKK